jgi:hypothetical protein
MKSVLLRITALVICLGLGSCKGVFFKHPEPSWVATNDKAFPREMCGYYTISDSLSKSGSSGIFIAPQKIGDSDSEFYALSDSVILRHEGSKYFLNIEFKEEENNHSNAWALVTLEEKGKGLNLSLFYPDTSITLLKNYTPVTRLPGDTTPYFIDPSATEFKKIMKQQLFWSNSHYNKVSEKQYEKLFRRKANNLTPSQTSAH